MQFSKNYKNKLFSITSAAFDEAALELFRFQAVHTPVYKEFITHLGIHPQNVSAVTEIPFIPIDFFKEHQVICNQTPTTKIFESSGTTGMSTSKHYFSDVPFYLSNCEKIFNQAYGELNEYAVFALLPSYIERGTSSLTAMAADFIDKSACSFSGFYLNNYEELIVNIQQAVQGNKKVLLLGVTFALLELAEQYPTDLSSVIVMETGGMKGRREEMTREEVHDVLKNAFQVTEIHSEYGMTELNSQVYSKGHGVFESSPWVSIQLRDLNDPLSASSTRKSGAINVIDLANVDSCAFIATQDLGRKIGEHQFEILGRIDHSDIRGCNLLVVE